MFPKGYIWHTTAGTEGAYNLGDARQGQGAAEEGELRRQAAAHPHQPPVRVPLQDGAGRGRIPEAGRLRRRADGGRLGDADAAPHRSRAVGHLHHPQPVPARARADRHPVGSLARLVVDAAAQDRSSTPSTRSPIRPSAPALWAEVQKAIYAEVPAIKIGDFNALSAQSPKLTGVVPAPWPYFWNASKAVTAAERAHRRARRLRSTCPLRNADAAHEPLHPAAHRRHDRRHVRRRHGRLRHRARRARRSGRRDARARRDRAGRRGACARGSGSTGRCRCSTCSSSASCCAAISASRSSSTRPVLTALADRAEPTFFLTLFAIADRVGHRHPDRHLSPPTGAARCSTRSTTTRRHARGVDPELLAGPAADPVLRRTLRLFPGLGLWRAGREPR